MKILGIDPGTGITGFGVIEADKKGYEIIDAGVFRTPANEQLSIRLETIYNHINEIINEHQPKHLAIELLYFSRNVTTAMSVSQARGVVLLAAEQSGLSISEYTPLQVKQSITGYGRAEKKQIQEMVKTLLKLDQVPKPDDCADALAIAITHAMTLKL